MNDEDETPCIMSATVLSSDVYENKKVEIKCGPDCQDASKCLCSRCSCCSECSSKCQDCPGTRVKSPTAELAKLLELSSICESDIGEMDVTDELETEDEEDEEEEEEEQEEEFHANVMLIVSDDDDAV